MDHSSSWSSPPPAVVARKIQPIVSTDSLNALEVARLFSLNCRTLCITFPHLSFSNLPPVHTLLSLNKNIQSLVLAKSRTPWFFMIFPTKELKEEAELELNNQKCGKGTIVVDNTKKLVPILADDLEDTRDNYSLAVHGIPHGVAEEDIRSVFNMVDRVTIAKRGGSAFLNYSSREQCEKDFLALGDVFLGGARVVALFGHNLKLKKKLSVQKQLDEAVIDLRTKLEMSYKEKEIWLPVLHFIDECRKNRNGHQSDTDDPSLLEIEDLILSSSLELDRMKKQFRRNKTREEVLTIKISWLDRLVTATIEKSGLTESEISVLRRGGLRQLVEDIWRYLDKFRDGEEDWSEGSVNIYKEGNVGDGSESRREVSERTRSRSPLISSRRERSSSTHEEENRKCTSDTRVPRIQSADTSYSSSSRSRTSSSPLSENSSKQCVSRENKDHKVYLDSLGINGFEVLQVVDVNDNRGLREVKVVEKTDEENFKNIVNNNSLVKFLKRKLSALGLKHEQSAVEAGKVMNAIRESVQQVEESSSMQHSELVDLLTFSGYNSGHVSVRLAADLVSEWRERRKVSEKAALIEGGGTQDDSIVVERKKSSRPPVEEMEEIPAVIMEVDEGYPRMALVMAFYMHTIEDFKEQVSKDLARAMVGVWITYGYTYQQLSNVGQLRDSQEVKEGMLRNMLNVKLLEGFVKPKSFGFSKLIKLTLFYYNHATFT